MTSRRAITLVLVLVCLTLAAAIIVPLALISGTHAVTAAYRSDALTHRLAGDSLVAVLPEWLEKSAELRNQLDRNNRATMHLQIGDIQVEAVLQDDTAKLPVAALFDRRKPEHLQRALERLATGWALPGPNVAREIVVAGCFDDLFDDANDTELFGDLQTPSVSDFASTLGSRVQLQRADAVVLEATLLDLKPGLGLELARIRSTNAKDGPNELLARVELKEAARRDAAARLTQETERYSLRIRTARGADVRWRYVICSAAESLEVLLDWEIAP